VDGQPAQVAFAGLAPGFVGLLQINIVIPEVPAGERALDISIGGAAANRTVLWVGNWQAKAPALPTWASGPVSKCSVLCGKL